MYFDQRAKKAEREAEARDIARCCERDSPELTAFLESTTPSAPGGAYIMEDAKTMAEQVTRIYAAEVAEARMLANEYWNGARWNSLTDRQRAEVLAEARLNVKRQAELERRNTYGNHQV